MDLTTLINLSPEALATLAITAVPGVCAWICPILSAPTASSGAVYRFLYALLNKLGGNVGRAKNADEVHRFGK